MYPGANRQPPMHVRRAQIERQTTSDETAAIKQSYEEEIANQAKEHEKEKSEIQAQADNQLSDYQATVVKSLDDLIAKVGADTDAGKAAAAAKSALIPDKPAANGAKK